MGHPNNGNGDTPLLPFSQQEKPILTSTCVFRTKRRRDNFNGDRFRFTSLSGYTVNKGDHHCFLTANRKSIAKGTCDKRRIFHFKMRITRVF